MKYELLTTKQAKNLASFSFNTAIPFPTPPGSRIESSMGITFECWLVGEQLSEDSQMYINLLFLITSQTEVLQVLRAAVQVSILSLYRKNSLFWIRPPSPQLYILP